MDFAPQLPQHCFWFSLLQQMHGFLLKLFALLYTCINTRFMHTATTSQPKGSFKFVVLYIPKKHLQLWFMERQKTWIDIFLEMWGKCPKQIFFTCNLIVFFYRYGKYLCP